MSINLYAQNNSRFQNAVIQNQNINVSDPNIIKANEQRGDQRDILENVQAREEQLTIMKLNCIAPAVKNEIAIRCDCPSSFQIYNTSSGCTCSLSGPSGSVNNTCTGCNTGFQLNGSMCVSTCQLSGLNFNATTCTCNPGYQENSTGTACVRSCQLTGLNFNATTCTCNTGYSLNNTGTGCVLGCALTGSNFNEATCTCNTGYIVNRTGTGCVLGCALTGSNFNAATCTCNSGYSLNSTGTGCVLGCPLTGLNFNATTCTCNTGYTINSTGTGCDESAIVCNSLEGKVLSGGECVDCWAELKIVASIDNGPLMCRACGTRAVFNETTKRCDQCPAETPDSINNVCQASSCTITNADANCQCTGTKTYLDRTLNSCVTCGADEVLNAGGDGCRAPDACDMNPGPGLDPDNCYCRPGYEPVGKYCRIVIEDTCDPAAGDTCLEEAPREKER
ncbi:MAG: hypothetical protein JNM93_00965 [Bacteriovoracaceae bacterium]|nr:hypothetical protein [Bacteriovoracaceae bacterium]